MDLAELFQYVKDTIKKNGNLSPMAYDLWIKDVELVSFDSTLAVLSTSTPLKKDFLEKRYMENMRAAFMEVLGVDIEIQVIVSGNAANTSAAAPIPPVADTGDFSSSDAGFASTMPSLPTGNSKNGDYEYTFDTFIIGTSNKFAHAACLAVAQNPGKGYNPLFIYGGSGLGKTHLLYAIMSEIKKNRPDTKVVYVKGEDFTNELITAIANKNTVEFRDKYRPADVLLMDDIQFIAGKEQTQEEFFHTF